MPKRRRSVGGGGARNPNSLANLRPAPAAPAGNDRARRHGVYAVVTADEREPEVRRIMDALVADAPLRDTDGGLPSADTMAVEQLAEIRVRLDRCAHELQHGGWLDQRTREPRDLVNYEARLRREARELMDALGMTPAARARLGLDLARTQQFDLARYWQDDADG